jgi:hypothetical protein
MKRHSCWVLAVAVIAGSVGSAAASGTQVDLTLNSAANSNAYTVLVNNGNGAAPTISYGYAGLLNFTAAPGGPIQTFCIELTQDVYFNQLNHTFNYTTTNLGDYQISGIPQNQIPQPGMGPDRANALLRLFAQHYTQDVFSGDSNHSMLNYNIANGAAFQLAVWEIVNDYTEGGSNHNLNLGGGSFQASGNAVSTAQGWLDTIGNNNGVTPDNYLIGYTSETSQDQIALIPGADLTTSVVVASPEPATAVLCVMGIAGMCTAGYRRRKPRCA